MADFFCDAFMMSVNSFVTLLCCFGELAMSTSKGDSSDYFHLRDLEVLPRIHTLTSHRPQQILQYGLLLLVLMCRGYSFCFRIAYVFPSQRAAFYRQNPML